MGTGYNWRKKKTNCIGAADRVIELPQPNRISRRDVLSQDSTEDDSDEEIYEDCSPTLFVNSKPLKSSGVKNPVAQDYFVTTLIALFLAVF